ncbi:linalool dehydratase/isomerase domain-containing protein [Sphingomonas bisphenolicum]
MTANSISADSVRRPVPYPELDRPYGPATTARLRRTTLILAILWLAGFAPVFLSLSPAAQSFGLGLIFPGAGFLHAGGLGNLLLLGLTWVLFGISFILYFGSGNHLAPLTVWLGSAAVAAARTNGEGNQWAAWLIASILAIVCGLVAWGVRRDHARGKITIAKSNAKLATMTLPAKPMFGKAKVDVGKEMSRDDLAFHRWFLERALQPLDSFEGYTQLDQFQFAALRYQVSYMQYALAMAQYTRTPAFHGYVSEAQRRLIEKMMQPAVWRYWAYENFWGNFRLDPDPIKRDNIMLSGYLLLMATMYESNTGDTRYNQPGAFTFKWNDRTQYVYDSMSLAQIVANNFAASKFGMFPCEPSLVFPICNVIAINGLKVHDRLHGVESMDDLLERYRFATEVEFRGPDSRPVGLRVERLGIDLKLPFPMDGRAGMARALGGTSQRVLGPGNFSPLVCSVLPDVVERELLLGGFARISKAVSSGAMKIRDFGRYDVGNYSNTGAGAHPWMSIVAREYGDEGLLQAINISADECLDPVEENGVRHYRALSGLSMAQMFMGRFSRTDGFFDLVNRGNPASWSNGPILAEAPYPDVLVARAVSDGDDLSLVLRPGAGGGRFDLGLARLRPGRRYVSNHGDVLTADAQGQAVLRATVTDRVEYHIHPAES